jgi:hypothetical protein
MELCWLYACATFLMTAIVQRPFPLPEAIGTFLLAAALSRVVQGMGLRVISVLGLQIIGFLLAASRIVYTFNYRAYPYFGKRWLVEFIGKPQEGLILVILLTFALLFWLAGVTLTRRSTAYLSICTRFDYGLAAFFCLFILKSLLLVKGGIEVQDPAPVLLLFAFFIFSLLAIGLARNSNKARRHFIAGYKGVGMIVSFAAVVLAFGSGLVFFFMTYLSAASAVGYEALKSAAGPLIPYLKRLLLSVFGKLTLQEPLFTSPDRGEAVYIPSADSSWWSELIKQILGGGVLGLGLMLGLIICALYMWYLLRRLLSRTSKEDRKRLDWQLVLLWAQRLWVTLIRGLKRAVQRLKGYRDAVQLYRAFLNWGRRSGRPHLLNETPNQYGSRLKKQFPSLAGEIEGIVDAFNLAVYGEVILDDAQMTLAKRSWKRLRSPRHWPARLKSWFFQEKG